MEILGVALGQLGYRSWCYREGKDRGCWITETSWAARASHLASTASNLAYARGYFDAEGGIPRVSSARFYVQYVQKNRPDLEGVHRVLLDNDIECGVLHNPSAAVDPEFWRFYVRSESWARFATQVSSWHPRKRRLLDERFSPVAVI